MQAVQSCGAHPGLRATQNTSPCACYHPCSCRPRTLIRSPRGPSTPCTCHTWRRSWAVRCTRTRRRHTTTLSNERADNRRQACGYLFIYFIHLSVATRSGSNSRKQNNERDCHFSMASRDALVADARAARERRCGAGTVHAYVLMWSQGARASAGGRAGAVRRGSRSDPGFCYWR